MSSFGGDPVASITVTWVRTKGVWQLGSREIAQPGKTKAAARQIGSSQYPLADEHGKMARSALYGLVPVRARVWLTIAVSTVALCLVLAAGTSGCAIGRSP